MVKPEFPVKKNLAGDGREPTLINVPDKRRLLKQYSYVMFLIKTLRDYFWQIVPLDKAVLTQEMKDLLIIFGL